MRPRLPWFGALAVSWLLTGCLPDNPSVEGRETTDAEASADTGAEPVETGLLGCPAGDRCTIVALSQTLDDRVELFSAPRDGAEAVYRGALDLDLVPNPGGDISGELLDEPYGLAWDGAALHVLVGHYPTRELGSLLRFPASGLADRDPGAWVPASAWFNDGAAAGLGVSLRPLERTEPLAMLVHPGSGQLLISVFANDLQVPDAMWTGASEVLVVDPATPGAELASVDPDCVGAWSLVALDDAADAVALACDGDERVVILDTAALGSGQAPSPRCVAEIPFADKRVRYLAPDGLGGVVVGEHPPILSASEDARIWWFDGACGLRGFSALEGATSWSFRELVALPADAGSEPRWLLARTDGDARGVELLAGDPAAGSVSPCGRLTGLDEAGVWTALGGTEPLRPHALGLSADGRGLALGVGPADYDNLGPGWGSSWWAELDYADEACDATVAELEELGALAPAVDPELPQTWRRGPDVVEVIEVQG